MDNLTHSLVGALIGQAGLKRRTGLAMPALVIGANLPDIDATCVVYGIESLAMRRGITHGPVAWVALPLALAGLLWWYDRWQAQRGTRPGGRAHVRFGWLLALAFIACLTHPALDWLNNYGIRLLAPFSNKWFYGDTLFIVDVWLWLGLGFATWLSLRREKADRSWRWPAITALAAAIVYIGWNWTMSALAVTHYVINDKGLRDRPRVQHETIIPVEVPFAPWKRELVVGRTNHWLVVPAGKTPMPENARPVTTRPCTWPDMDRLSQSRPDLAAFLFWSRAPYVEIARDGRGIVLRDARFAELGGDRFSVSLPAVACRERPVQEAASKWGAKGS